MNTALSLRALKKKFPNWERQLKFRSLNVNTKILNVRPLIRNFGMTRKTVKKLLKSRKALKKKFPRFVNCLRYARMGKHLSFSRRRSVTTPRKKRLLKPWKKRKKCLRSKGSKRFYAGNTIKTTRFFLFMLARAERRHRIGQ